MTTDEALAYAEREEGVIEIEDADDCMTALAVGIKSLRARFELMDARLTRVEAERDALAKRWEALKNRAEANQWDDALATMRGLEAVDDR